MSDAIKRMESKVGNALANLESLFQPGAKLTFLARFQDNDEADVMVSSDSLDGIAALIDRMRIRGGADSAGRDKP